MNLIDALKLPSLQQATIVAGADGMHRTIRWVPIVELPDPLPWVSAGDFLLTTGFNWPRDEEGIRTLITSLAAQGLTGIGLAVPQYFDRMPEAACRAADELSLPLIEIPWEIQFHTITEQIISSILDLQYKLQEQSKFIHHEIMRIALDTKDLPEIVRSIGKLIGKQVAIQHPEGSILASNADRDWQRLLGELNKSEALSPASKPKRLPADPESATPARLVCPITIKKELVGLLWVIEHREPISDLDLRAIQSASIVIALHIAQQRALTSLEAQLGHSFLDSLIENNVQPTPQVLRRAALHGFDPESAYSVGLIAANISVPLTREGLMKRERLAEKLTTAMEQLGIPTVCSFMQNQIVFLIPKSVSAEQLWHKLKAPDLFLAVSLPHPKLENVHQGYKEVMSIIPHINYGQIQLYENMIIYRVLAGDRDAHSAFLNKLFAPLQQTKSGEMLLRSLLTFAETGFQLKRAAEKLNIHPKTLRYRLDQIITLGNFDFQSPETQFMLQLACRIIKMDTKSSDFANFSPK